MGGWHVDVYRSTLTTASESQNRTVLGALFEGERDKRVPRDAKGRLVLDESPTCFKHILRTLLGTSQEIAGLGRTSLVPFTSTKSVKHEDGPYIRITRFGSGLRVNTPLASTEAVRS